MSFHPAMAIRRLLLVALFMIGFAEWSSAQMSPPGADVARPIPGAGHDYIHMLAETVNPANGSLSVKIDLPTHKGRGISFPYAILYNSGSVNHLISGMPGAAQYEASSFTERTNGGWGDTLPYATASFWNYSAGAAPYNSGSCLQSANYVFYDLAGESHLLGLTNSGYAVNAPSGVSISPLYCSEIGFMNYTSGHDDEVSAQSFVTCNGYPTSPEPLSCNYAFAPFTVTDEDGTVYTFPYIMTANMPPGYSAATTFSYPYSIEDRNGNVIAINTNHGSSAPVFTDTLGGQAVSITGTATPGSTQTVTVGGLSYTVAYTSSTANFQSAATITTQPASGIGCGSTMGVPNDGSGAGTIADSGISTVIQSITLPNGKQYLFKYSNQDPIKFGLLDEIDYPDGGWVKYTWKYNDTPSDFIQYTGESGGVPSGLCNIEYSTPAIATRTVGYTPGVAAQVQTFTYYTSWIPQTFGSEWGYKTTQVSTLDSVTGQTAITLYTYGSVVTPNGGEPQNNPGNPGQTPVETSIQYFPWGGGTTKALRTVNKTWNDPSQMSSEQTILDNGLSTQTVYCYQGTQVVEKDEYDYGVPEQSVTQPQANQLFYGVNCWNGNTSLPKPSRITMSFLQGFPGAQICPVDPVYGQAPIALPCNYKSSYFYKPSQIITYDSNGNRAAETDLYYDGSTTLGAAGPANTTTAAVIAATHDTTTPQLFLPASTTPRGNVTQVVKWENSGTSPTTSYTYDTTGQVLTAIDACGNAACGDMTGANHQTLYSYADSPSGANPYGPSNAYLTQITLPSSQTNGFSYNYTTGSVVGSTDANGQPTTYQYGTQPTGCGTGDQLQRLTEIVYPDFGKTTYCYNDSYVANVSPSITTSQLMSSSVWKTALAIRDGLGHTIHSQVTSDPQSTDSTDTTYTGMGWHYTVSNPHRPSVAATSDGTSTYAYDALGRPTMQCHPDNGTATAGPCVAGNSYIQWTYSGNVTTERDEDGNTWQRTSDAFGRLTNVVEPGSLITTYQYDALNNLKCADQWGTGAAGQPCASALPRSFSYDSLSQLISSSNPETGTINYGYDANGNLTSKTDARGITTNFGYDQLNRLLSKTYSNDTTGTASSCYQYDVSSVPGAGGNLIGRLTNSWTQKGACSAPPPTTVPLTRRSFLAYDAMGRVFNEQQCTLANCSTSTPYIPAYTYDLAGNVLTHSNGIAGTGAMTFTNSYDTANHLLTVTSNNTQYPTILFSSPSYSSPGGLTGATFGTGLVLSRGYDNRLRIGSETDIGNSVTNPTPGAATITITGTEQTQ